MRGCSVVRSGGAAGKEIGKANKTGLLGVDGMGAGDSKDLRLETLQVWAGRGAE